MLIFGGVLQLFIWICSTNSSILNQKVCRINSFWPLDSSHQFFKQEKPSTPKSHPNMVNDLETVVILSKDAVNMSPYFNILSFRIFRFPRCFFPPKKSAFHAAKGHAPKVGFQNRTWLWTKKIHWRTTRLVSCDSHLSFLRGNCFSKWINGLSSNRGLDLSA